MSFTTETGFNTTLAQKLDAGSADASIKLASLPITVTSGVLLIGNGSNKEWVYFSGTTPGTVLVTGCQRGLDKDAISTTDVTSTNILSHRVGDPVRLVQHSLAQNNKPDLDSNNTFSGTNTFESPVQFDDADAAIRRDGDDLKFKDPNQAEVSLSDLAAAAGVDDKTKVSATDTTSGYLEGKIVATNGVKESVTSPGGDERYQLEIDTTTLPTNLDSANTFFGLTDATGTEVEKITDGSKAGDLHTHDMIAGAAAITLAASTGYSTVVVTDGTPKIIEVQLTSASISNDNATYATAGYFSLWSNSVFNGSTLAYEKRCLIDGGDDIGAIAASFITTWGNATITSATQFGSVPVTNGHRFDLLIASLSATGCTIRINNIKTGSPANANMFLTYKIWT